MADRIGKYIYNPLFNLYGLDFERMEEQSDQFIVYMSANYLTIQCPKCGRTRAFSRDGDYVRDCLDLPIQGKATVLRINAGRYNCKNTLCSQKKFVGRFPDVYGPNDKITYRLKDRIANSDFCKYTFENIAAIYHVDPETVRKAFLEKVKQMDKRSEYESVSCLGIDEAHLANEMRGVLVDCSSPKAKLVDILPDRKKATIISALNHFEQPEKIKYVTMDMSVAYREAVREVLPDAMIIIDRFHVLQYVLDATKKPVKTLAFTLKRKLRSYPWKRELSKNQNGTERERIHICS